MWPYLITFVTLIALAILLNKKYPNQLGKSDGDLTIKVGRQPLTAARGTMALARLQEQKEWIDTLPPSPATEWALSRIKEWAHQLKLELKLLDVQSQLTRLEDLKK